MSWVRLDDQIAYHPKTVRAGNEAFGVWVRMVAHACAYLTDGVVETSVALSLCNGKRKLLDHLVTVGFLELDPAGYRVHDFADWNPSAAEVREERRKKSEKKAEAGRLGGRRSGESRRGAAEANHEADAKQTRSRREAAGQAEAKRNEAPSPSPSLEIVYDDLRAGVDGVGQDRTPLVHPPDPDAPKPVAEAVEIAAKHGIDRGTVATCLPRWRGQRRAFPTAMAFVAAHGPKGFGAGYVVAAFRELDPDLVADWDRAGRPAPTAPPPRTPEKPPVRFDLGLDEPTPPPRKARQPPPPPLRRVGDASDGSQGVQGPADAPAGLRAAGGAT